jgi:hypothetical protein
MLREDEMATIGQRPTTGAVAGKRPADAVLLGPADLLPERAFTDPEETTSDLRVMSRMLALEGEVAHTRGADVDGPAISGQTREGRRQLLAVPDGRALLRARDVSAVGFFGRRRDDVDHGVLFEHERRITQTFPDYAAAPAHYEHIRLHTGRIPGPFLGVGEVQVLRRLYLDFSGPAPWRAVRIWS